MSLTLTMDKSAIIGHSQDLKPWVVTRGRLGDKTVVGAVGGLTDNSLSFAQQTVSPGSTTNIKFTPARNTIVKMEAMYLSFKIQNTGSSDLIVYNPYDLISSIELHINGTKMLEYDNYQIMMLVADYLAACPSHNPENDIPKMMLEFQAVQNFGGTTVGAGAIVPFELSLYVLFPFLENWITNSRQNIQSLGLELTFRPTTGTVHNAAFCRSNNMTSSYDPATISFRNIALRYVSTTLVDARLVLTAPQQFFVHSNWDIINRSVDWSTPGNSIKVLLDGFPKRQMIQSLSVFIRPRGLQTTYDSAEACKWLSGPRYINFKMTKVGYSDSTVDYSLHVHRLQQYFMRQQQMTLGHALPIAMMNQTDGSSYYLVRNCLKLDFRNIDIEVDRHNLLAGLDTFETGLNFEFEFICREAIHADCEMVFALETKRFTTLDNMGMPILIKPEKLLTVA